MNNQWKMVPVEPTEEMIYAIATRAHCGDSGKDIWSEALAYAPVPPAGDVEVGFEWLHPDDRAHITRLTAELDEALAQSKWRGEMAASNCAEYEKQVVIAAGLQSELTKARELLMRLRNCRWIPTAEWQHEVSEVLAHQSAPAAKGNS